MSRDYSEESVIVPEQRAIAVYRNTVGDIVIRQAGAYPDDDAWILVRPENARAVAEAIMVEAGLHQEPSAVPTKDSTAAARQRRYRSKHRNGNVLPLLREAAE